jgi:hypothetical protein
MKLLRFILLLAAFLGGYYLGHRPDSPDIFVMAKGAWQKINAGDGDDTVADDGRRDGRPAAPAAEAGQQDDPTLSEAALAYLRDKARSERHDAARKDEDLWGYTRPAPRRRR